MEILKMMNIKENFLIIKCMEKDHILLKTGNLNYFNLKIYLAKFLLDNFVMDIDLVKESINQMTWKEIILVNG
jgi:hypothetical protein